MSASDAHENSIPSNKALELVLPENFKEIHPSMKAEKILPYFRVYLSLLLQQKDSNLNSDSSVSTYQSCATCWVRRYAQGHQLQHVLESSFIAKTSKDDKTQEVFRRSYPMTRCGLNHLVKLYKLSCKQFHPKLSKIFKKKNIALRKRKRVAVENVPTLNASLVDQFSQEFITRYVRQKTDSVDSFPKSVQETKEFLKLFDQYRSERLTETVWELSGIPKDVLMANSYLHDKKNES